MLRIDKQQAESIFQGISKKYKLMAPVEKIGKGRFSDTNLLTYDEVNSFAEIEFFKKTYFSAKSVLFPIRQTLFTFRNNKMGEVDEEGRPTIIFLRSCDIHAIKVMDAHFLGEGFEDPYYRKIREKVKFFLIECEKSFENCFCVSMGTNRTDDYSAFMRKTDSGYEVQLRDEELKAYFPAKEESVKDPSFVEQNTCSVNIPEEIDVSIFENDIWKEYTLRCIACGRCTVSCPTCTCFSLQDIAYEDKEGGERKRLWSSCQVKKFALLAGNHDFRAAEGDRMRYRVLHKLRDFKMRQGFHMCVGCGRCDDTCPEYISMFKCIEKINRIIEAT